MRYRSVTFTISPLRPVLFHRQILCSKSLIYFEKVDVVIVSPALSRAFPIAGTGPIPM